MLLKEKAIFLCHDAKAIQGKVEPQLLEMRNLRNPVQAMSYATCDRFFPKFVKFRFL